MADVLPGLKNAMSTLFRMQTDFEIVTEWEISFSEASKMASTGRTPEVSITFPRSGICLQEVGAWESIYLSSFLYGPECSLMIRGCPDRAAYKLTLVRAKKT